MPLTLYYHPFSSFCQKVLIALYEKEIPFEARLVDFSDEQSAAEFRKIWPIGQFPVLRDDAVDGTIPESSIIIEYLSQRHPAGVQLLPADSEMALQTRLRDRFFDLHVHVQMQKVVTDRLRPAGRNDAYGVEMARVALRTAYGSIEREMEAKTWAIGDAFTMADCAAAPALYYANLVEPLGEQYPHTAGYLTRLIARPSYARALEEARPYFGLFPE
jgi:glutathione S-transferase